MCLPKETVPGLRTIHVFTVPNDVEHDRVRIDVVSDAIIPDPISPLSGGHVDEPAAVMRVGWDALSRLEYLPLDFLRKFPEVVFKSLGGNKPEPSHLAGAGIDRPEGVETRNLAAFVLSRGPSERFLKFLVPTLFGDLEQVLEIVDAQQDHLRLPFSRDKKPFTLRNKLDDLPQM